MRKVLVFMLTIAGLGLYSVVSADSTTVTQSYNADSNVLAGMIVELKSSAANLVTPLPSNDLSKMLGVVVPVHDASLVLTSPSSSNQQVLVAATGRYNMLVSNEGGAIKAGDYLTISSLAGIGMKANVTQPEIIGQAAASFNGTSNTLGSVSLKNGNGIKVTESVGSILINVHLAANPLYQKQSTVLPGFLSQAANSLANKQVSSARVYLGGIILTVSLFITGIVLYGGARGGVIAIGRNPLANRAIGQSLFKIIALGLLIFLAGVLSAYLILRF